MNFTMWQLKILLSIISVHPAASQNTILIVNFQCHHAATQDPGHGTKFVTLPSPVLLYYLY